MQENKTRKEGAGKEKEMADLAKYLRDRSLDIESYLSEEEWQQYLKNNTAGEPVEDKAEEDYAQVYDATFRKSRRQKNLYRGIGLVALLVAGTGLFILLNRQNSASRPTAPVAHLHKNATDQLQRIALPDGSFLVLYPGSEISYTSAFNKERRDLYLTGKAVFEVTGQYTKPFIVYCRTIATTVLGTKFMVNGLEADPWVHLYQGRVVVQVVRDSAVRQLMTVGQTLAYKEQENVFRLLQGDRTDDGSGKGASATQGNTGRQSAPAASPASVPGTTDTVSVNGQLFLNFRNQSLSTIFDQLAERYQVEIRYPTSLAFSSNVLLSVNAGQPIEKILENLCSANGMKVSRLDKNTFTISK